MADITKRVDRAIPANQRTQSFTDSDASQDDVLLVEASLGHPASHLTIEPDNAMQVRFNVYHTLYPQRGPGSGLTETDSFPNVTLATSYKSEEPAIVTIGAGETFAMENEIPVRDIELVTASGVFDIFVS